MITKNYLTMSCRNDYICTKLGTITVIPAVFTSYTGDNTTYWFYALDKSRLGSRIRRDFDIPKILCVHYPDEVLLGCLDRIYLIAILALRSQITFD